jgi:hypothetical protein
MKGAALFLRDPVTREEKLLSPIGAEASIGKGPGASVVLNNIRCDLLHALIERDDHKNEFVVIDLGSHFGTFIRGKRVQEARVKPGEVFLIGNQHLVLRETQSEVHIPDRKPVQSRKQRKVQQQEQKQKGPQGKAETDVLQVSLYWGDKLLELRSFEPGSEITLGLSHQATFNIALADPKYQKIPFRLARFTRGLVELHIPPDANGLVWTKNDTYAVDFMRHKDKSTEGFNGDLKCNLRTGDRADLTFGELSLQFRFVSPAERIPTQLIPKMDRTFFKMCGILALIYGALFVWLSNQNFSSPEKTLEDLPQHLKRSVYNAGLAKALQRRRSAIGDLAKDKTGGRAKGEEGRASAKKAEKAKPVIAKAEKINKKFAKAGKINKALKNKKAVKQDVESQEDVKVDLDSAFSAKPSKASNLSKDTAEVSAGKGNGNTVAAFSDAGGFARGTKGLGSGGGGESVGIGALKGTGTGGGRGAGDYGILPSKGHEIRVPETEELVILGGLDRDVIAAIIRRYLPQIQHCYEQQLVTNSKLKGKVTVSFIISGTGSVQSADVQESTLRNAPTERCMLSKIMGWKFPKPRGGGTVGVKYPFLLMSTNSGGDDD